MTLQYDVGEESYNTGSSKEWWTETCDKKKKEQLYYSCALFEKDNANNKKTDNCKLLFYKYRKLFWKEETL